MRKQLDKIISFWTGKGNCPASSRPMPSRAEIIEIMRDKQLSFSDEVIRVLYNAEGDKRFVVLKRDDGLFRYLYERLEPFNEEEWIYISRDENALPGNWIRIGRQVSLFGTEREAWNDLMLSPEYMAFFSASIAKNE